MTTYNKQTLGTFFQTGDIPQGSDFQNLIDSQVNIVETSVQSMGGPLNTPELITSRVSAGNANFTGTVSATNLDVTNILTATISANIAVLNSLSVSGLVSAGSINVAADVSATSGTVYASAMRSTNGFIAGTGIVSAAGTTQGTAAVLTNVINRGKGVVDGTTTGFAPLNNRTGLVQYLFNEGVSANLWPPTGGTINGLPVNTAFSLTASAMVTIVHLTASAYAVK